jgi:hypothetical protein
VQCLGTMAVTVHCSSKNSDPSGFMELKKSSLSFYQMQQMGLLLGQKFTIQFLKIFWTKFAQQHSWLRLFSIINLRLCHTGLFHYCDWDPSSSPKPFSFSLPCLSCFEGLQFCFAMRTICYLTYDNIILSLDCSSEHVKYKSFMLIPTIVLIPLSF